MNFLRENSVPYTSILIVGIVAVCIIVAIVVLSMQTSSPYSITKGPIRLFSPTSPIVVDRPTVRKMFQNTYSLSFYIHIDAVPDVRVSATPILTWPRVWDVNYNSSKEELEWVFHVSPGGSTQQTVVIIPHIPLQKWIQIAITFEGRTADIYANGTLLRSTTLPNIPPIPNASITIVPGGARGEIAYIQSWKDRRRVSDIQSNYIHTSDSQGRPLIDPELFQAFQAFRMFSWNNLFCPGGDCNGKAPVAAPSKKWEFPYA